MAEEAGAADLIAGGRLQLGVSRGSPQLGVAYNANMLETIAREIAPALGWQPSTATTAE